MSNWGQRRYCGFLGIKRDSSKDRLLNDPVCDLHVFMKNLNTYAWQKGHYSTVLRFIGGSNISGYHGDPTSILTLSQATVNVDIPCLLRVVNPNFSAVNLDINDFLISGRDIILPNIESRCNILFLFL